MIIVWISSICLNLEKLHYLYECLNSCLKLHQIDSIVLSIYTELGFLSYINNKRIVIKRRDKPLKQFEHIKLLCEEETYPWNTWITFMDDDDILLPSITTYWKSHEYAFVANQYITCDKENHIMEELAYNITEDNIEKYKNDMLISSDFSGTSARYYLVKQFIKSVYPKHLNTYNKYVDYFHLTDIVFMDYLTKRTAKVTEQPIVIHRVIPTKSKWKEDTALLLETLTTKLQTLLS